MDESEYQRRKSRLLELAKVIEKMPAEIRAAAFDLIKGYVTGQASEGEPRKHSAKATPVAAVDDGDDESFFGKFEHNKPADNAKLIAANHFRKYGSEPFSVDEIAQRAKEVGITVPGRLDMTFQAAKVKGKNLFTRAGRGNFKPTVHGETYLKATYSVKKGTMTKPRATTAE